jgi:hypothetical protein
MSVLAKQCDYNGKHYTFVVTDAHQARCPKWDPEKDSNPPLPASEALSKVNKFIATIKTEDDLFWKFEALALTYMSGWMWRARYRLSKKVGMMTGAWSEMECWILMDGTVIQPSITEGII